MTTTISREVRIEGRVQGVSYRAWTRQQAMDLGLSGWVRNCQDGSVEALIQGPQAAVETLLALLWKGPAAARVTTVSVAQSDAAMHSSFEVTA
ncbi:MAG: acylphosphatase [Alcanivorax sp.]|nr:acylphosphatase [Alcanivorax sp.]